MKLTLADRIKSQVLNENQKAKSDLSYDRSETSGLDHAKSESLQLEQSRKNYSLNSEAVEDDPFISVSGLSNFGGNQ